MNIRTLSIACALIGAVSLAGAAEATCSVPVAAATGTAHAAHKAASGVKHVAHKAASAASEAVTK